MMAAQSRRTMLGGGMALATLMAGRVYAAMPETGLRDALDMAFAEADPVKALAGLDPFVEAGLSPSERLDLVTARAGLRVDALLARSWGRQRYTLLLRRQFASDADPIGVERLLQAALDRCLVRANALFDGAGIGGSGTGACFARLWQDPRHLYADDDAGRDRAVADMNRTLSRYRDRTLPLLGSIPAWCRNVSAIRMSAADEAAGRGGYRALPTPDKPGGYYVDLKAIRRRPTWTLPSVVAHELLPGHMVQMPMEAQAAPHKLRQRYAPGYAEGWATYAETLVASQGLYDGDPLAELGHLHWLLFRLGRGLVDIGIHLHGWSRDQARDRLIAWQGEPAYFAPFDRDIERIEREPANRAAEALYWLAIAQGARGLKPERLMHYHQGLLAHGGMRGEEIARLARRVRT